LVFIDQLATLSKIYEHVILDRFKWIENEERVDLTGTFQHGFKKNRGTETAGLDLQSKISQITD